MPANVNLALQIYQQALAGGVPPSIALAVAQKESGISQWTPSGNLATGTSGEVGVFQIMPQTAAGLGVDPSDVDQNIQGGISLLAQLYQKYGDWAKALSAYNSGSPNGSPSYANSVLALAGQNDAALSSIVPSVSAGDLGMSDDSGDAVATISPWVIGGVAAAALVAVILWD